MIKFPNNPSVCKSNKFRKRYVRDLDIDSLTKDSNLIPVSDKLIRKSEIVYRPGSESLYSIKDGSYYNPYMFGGRGMFFKIVSKG
jgi:hypothetical protein